MRKAKKSMFDVSLWKNTAEYNQYALRLYEMCLARGSWVMPDTVDTRFLEQVNRRKPKTMSELADVWYKSHDENYGRNHHYNGSRYHMLNLHATFTKGTVEFRLFQFDKPSNGKQNGLHAGQLKSYIQLCLALSQMAKEVRTASPKPQQSENPKYAMRTWLLRLGFIGDEFKTARETLTKRLAGDTAFRNGRAA